MWIPESAVLIRGRRLIEAPQRLLEEIRYTDLNYRLEDSMCMIMFIKQSKIDLVCIILYVTLIIENIFPASL